MMSEKKKKREEEEEEEEEEETMLEHFYHEHPLHLSEYSNEMRQCYGCTRGIFSGEMVYRCHKPYCGTNLLILHEECAEMPREIRVSMHPQHTLIQKKMYYPLCEVCGSIIMQIGYSCSGSCDFKIHVGCALDIDLVRNCIDHPSHPHQLTLQWKPGRSCSTRCHACGTIHKGNTYVCAHCQYWVLDSCANLPTTVDYRHLHHHALSLAFRLPLEYIKFNFNCAVCFKGFFPRYWVYHCGICRYVVHVNCAIRSSPATARNIDANAGDEEEEAIAFPISDAEEELIWPFVKRVGGEVETVPDENAKYKFHNHDHELSLISSSSSLEEDEEENSSDDDDDDLMNHRRKSELICDGCTTPIFQKKQKSYYMSCGECKYFLHWACFNLPSELPSHPLHLQSDHSLILQTTPKLDFTHCSICYYFPTNGLIYNCTKCRFMADIKCASLPHTIKHAAHTHHNLKLLGTGMTRNWRSYRLRLCGACDESTWGKICYRCDICGIMFHSSCALLQSTVSSRRWDKHPLPLTYDASADHPTDFYCDVCEIQMNPRMWMYHCRSCDVSVHPLCFPTATGLRRNIVFGQRYVVAPVHHHPLVYQLTTKLHCDVCSQRKKYGRRGFQCDSHKCEFFMCSPCAAHHHHEFQAVD